MKKIFILCTLIFSFNSRTFSQLSNYGFSAYSNSYNSITGTIAPLDYTDNGHTGLIPIGFSFVYDGVTYTALDASSNGMLKLGTAISSQTDVAFLRTLQQNPERPIIAPLWDDMMTTSVNDISYQTTGISPNKVFTIQWAQVRWPYATATAGIEFQVKFYEGTNKIEFIYNQLPGSIFGAGAVIGITALATGTGNYWSLQNAGSSPGVSSTSQALISTKPATGQVYAFLPLSPCSTPLSSGTTVASKNMVCTSTNFDLNVNDATQASGLNYQWQSSADNNSWQDIPGATAISLSTTQTTSTYYRRSISCGTATAYSTSVLVSQLATPMVTSGGPTSFCDGGSVMLTSSATSGNQWYKNGIPVGGANQPVLNASVSGDYTVVVTSASCSAPASAPVTVTVIPKPSQATVTAGGPVTFCDGGSVTLASSSSSGNQWYLNGTTINGANLSSYTTNQSGIYTVIVTANGCSSPAAPGTTVTVNPIPATPVINLTLNAFVSSASTGNQWYKDGVLIPGATDQSYLAFAFGVYTTKVTLNNCTSAVSNSLGYTPAGLGTDWNDKKLVITNPVNNELLIRYNGNMTRFVVTVSDLYGRIMARSSFTNTCRLNTSQFASGCYVVTIINQTTHEQSEQIILKQ